MIAETRFTPGDVTPVLGAAPVGSRAIDQPTKLTGYAAVFGRPTVIGNEFREVIERGAFTAALKRDDTIATFNHNVNWVLGRSSAGTLTLVEDDYGLRYTVTINLDDPHAVSVLAQVRRRDVRGSSFKFSIDHPEDILVERDRASRLPLVRVLRVRLHDVGPVVIPAYTEATVSARGTWRDAR